LDVSVPSRTATARVASDATGYGLRFLGKHGWRMMVWFIALLLPLWGFASLGGELHKKAIFPFDGPMLNGLHALATPALDRFFLLMTRLGYMWGVIPIDAFVLLFLVLRRRFRDGLFFGFAVIGSAALNIVAKNHYSRTRPDLWIPLRPETTYSFPSGHAMGSITLALAMILLCWPTRWRWPVIITSLLFVVLVGLSRIYLGVHYPSDILAGWTAATAWTLGMYILVDQKAPPPPPSAAPSRDTVGAKTAFS
jgi:membrane-associated phospholipid phosphatase